MLKALSRIGSIMPSSYVMVIQTSSPLAQAKFSFRISAANAWCEFLM
jgi:hypothetical protein